MQIELLEVAPAVCSSQFVCLTVVRLHVLALGKSGRFADVHIDVLALPQPAGWWLHAG